MHSPIVLGGKLFSHTDRDPSVIPCTPLPGETMKHFALAILLALPAAAQMPPMPGQEGTDAFNLGVLGAEGL
jgi:hypothetical protein